jgi:hypothetical protein
MKGLSDTWYLTIIVLFNATKSRYLGLAEPIKNPIATSGLVPL